MGSDEARRGRLGWRGVEIVQYIRGGDGRRWTLLLIPVIFVGVAVPWAWSQPVEYRTSATAFVQPTSGFTGPTVIRQVVDAFVDVTSSSTVVDRVGAETGISAQRLSESLTVAAVGASALVEVTLTGPNPELNEAAVQSLIKESFSLSLESLIAQTEIELDAVSADAARASGRVEEAEDRAGDLLPPIAYQRAVTERNRIAQLVQDPPSFEGAPTASQGDLQAAQEALDQAEADYKEYTDLTLREAQKRNQVVVVESRLAQFQARQESIDGAVFDSETTQVNRRPFLLQVAVGAAVAGLLVAGLLLVVTEWFSARRRAKREKTEFEPSGRKRRREKTPTDFEHMQHHSEPLPQPLPEFPAPEAYAEPSADAPQQVGPHAGAGRDA